MTVVAGSAAGRARPAGGGAGALRRRTARLRDAADVELRRRGVIRLAPDAQPAPARSGVRGAATVRQLYSRLPTSIPPLPSREQIAAELSVRAMSATGSLALALRRVAGRDVIDMELLMEVAGFVARIAALRESHRDGSYAVDEFGFDADYAEALLPLARLLYRRYWRVTTTGVTNVPRRGAALLVANHSGVLPWDGAMVKTALFEEGVERHARALVAQWFFTLPGLSWFLRRTGQTVGDPSDTQRLLSAGELVLVFPEGIRGASKSYRERYRLRRFGRGGFVCAAIRAQVPIIPVSIVGSEEIHPMLADLTPVARLIGFPFFPVTLIWPWLGPLGLVPLPSKWRIQFHEAVRTDELPPAAADDASTVMRISDTVRDVVQDGLITNLMERRSIFRG